MLALRLPLLALLAASAHGRPGLLGPKNVSQEDAEFERLYVAEVNSELVNIYTFSHTVTRNRVRPPPARPSREPSERDGPPCPPPGEGREVAAGVGVSWPPAPRERVRGRGARTRGARVGRPPAL